MERIARDKHSCLLLKSVNYGRKKFYRIGRGKENMVKDLAFLPNRMGKHLALTANIRLAWYNFTVTNTLAYLAAAYVTKKVL
jgi:hypothetical protein